MFESKDSRNTKG